MYVIRDCRKRNEYDKICKGRSKETLKKKYIVSTQKELIIAFVGWFEARVRKWDNLAVIN